MKLKIFALSCFIVIIAGGCNTPTDNNVSAEGRFPEVFLQAGSDADYSYISLRTIRLRDGHLKSEVTGWGIEETGLFLDRQIDNGSLVMHIMGKCGLVATRTWVKRTFDHIITKTAEDTLKRILVTTFQDTLAVSKVVRP